MTSMPTITLPLVELPLTFAFLRIGPQPYPASLCSDELQI